MNKPLSRGFSESFAWSSIVLVIYMKGDKKKR
jgi:hypothetical protein